MMTARIPVRSRRQAMDWSLVLISQEIEATIDHEADRGWGLIVAEQDSQRAIGILKQYQLENRGWRWRQKLPAGGALFDWASLGWVLVVSGFFWIQTHAPSSFRDCGLMDAIAVSHGEWWRLFTAIFLHADLGHYAMNVSIGFFLLGLVMGNFGTGLGLLASYVAGAGGNVATWMIFSDHRSLGASGMVMACVGLLASQSIFLRRGTPNKWKYIISGVAGGIMLFALLGLSPDSDVLAHLGGFISGLVLGIILLAAPKLRQNTMANVFAGIAFCVLVILPWWLALNRLVAK